MKTLILVCLTLFAGAAALFFTKVTGNFYSVWIVGLGVSTLFAIRAINKAKKLAMKREQQRLFNEWFRNHDGFRRSY